MAFPGELGLGRRRGRFAGCGNRNGIVSLAGSNDHVLAIDLPSGVDASTGEIPGAVVDADAASGASAAGRVSLFRGDTAPRPKTFDGVR